MIYMKFHSVDLKSEMNICTCIFIINIYSLHHYFLFLSDLTDVAKAVDCCNSTSSTHLCFKYHIKSKSQDVSPQLCCKSCIYIFVEEEINAWNLIILYLNMCFITAKFFEVMGINFLS